ncbi:MAG: glycosyltransferase family 2 protein [Bacillota bacterium]|nr:MAG: glycosyltransferase [Bacillota bacterium]
MATRPAPAVSVIVPTYNRPGHLRECLRALAAQTYPDFEVIVVNDAGAPVEEVVAGFPRLRITLINQPANRGHVAARNRGLDAARGTYIAFCDDDDLWLPGHLAGLVAAVEAGADLAYSDAEVVVFAQTPAGRMPRRREVFAFDFDPDLLRRWNFIPPSTVLYRRDLHRRLGPLDEAMADYWDWDWWLRVAPGHRVERVPVASVLIAVDAGGGNASAVPERMAPNLARLVAKHRLGPLPTSNFLRMLSEPELQPYRRPSRVVWDGRMPVG